MSYTPHEWTTGETITAAKLNNIEEGIEEGIQGSAGSSYDLVIKYVGANMGDFPSTFSASDWDVEGDILSIEQKVADHEKVTGICIIPRELSWTAGNANTDMLILPLTDWFCPYTWLRFAAIYQGGNRLNPGSIYSLAASFQYDEATGALLDGFWSEKVITTS